MTTSRLPTDHLFLLERKIARRADELARELGSNPQSALDHWRRAERETWREVAREETDFCSPEFALARRWTADSVSRA